MGASTMILNVGIIELPLCGEYVIVTHPVDDLGAVRRGKSFDDNCIFRHKYNYE